MEECNSNSRAVSIHEIYNGRQKQNKRRSRTAVFSANVADKKLSKKQPINFSNEPNFTKNMSMETLSKKIQPIASGILQFENRNTKKISWIFLHAQLINFPFYVT